MRINHIEYANLTIECLAEIIKSKVSSLDSEIKTREQSGFFYRAAAHCFNGDTATKKAKLAGLQWLHTRLVNFNSSSGDNSAITTSLLRIQTTKGHLILDCNVSQITITHTALTDGWTGCLFKAATELLRQYTPRDTEEQKTSLRAEPMRASQLPAAATHTLEDPLPVIKTSLETLKNLVNNRSSSETKDDDSSERERNEKNIIVLGQLKQWINTPNSVISFSRILHNENSICRIDDRDYKCWRLDEGVKTIINHISTYSADRIRAEHLKLIIKYYLQLKISDYDPSLSISGDHDALKNEKNMQVLERLFEWITESETAGVGFRTFDSICLDENNTYTAFVHGNSGGSPPIELVCWRQDHNVSHIIGSIQACFSSRIAAERRTRAEQRAQAEQCAQAEETKRPPTPQGSRHTLLSRGGGGGGSREEAVEMTALPQVALTKNER